MANEKFNYGGLNWGSVKECCTFFGTTEKTINNYMDKFGVSVEDALDKRRLELDELISHPNNWDEYESKIKSKHAMRLAKYYNVNYSMVTNIMRETGMGVEGAIEEAMKREDEKWVIVSGKLYNSLFSACSDLHIDPRTIYRLSEEQDIDPTEAIELYVYLRDSRGGEKSGEHN